MIRRLSRILRKLRLRASLAWQVLVKFEDTFARSSIKVSFSQRGEDLIIWHILETLGIRSATYLDIGAHHPTYLSNTALLHALGHRGMNIEPDPALFAAIAKHRPADINLNIGIAPKSGTLPYFRMITPSLNTFSESEATRMASELGIPVQERVELPVEPIASVLRSHRFKPTVLTLDAEGLDADIMHSWDFEWHRPAILCVETLHFSTDNTGTKQRALIEFITGQGYEVRADTDINTVFVDARLNNAHRLREAA